MSVVIIPDTRLLQDTCRQWTDCLTCVADTGCGYCASLGQCIQGNWFGVINKTQDFCPVNDYYHKQCQFSSLPIGIMASVALFFLLILVLIGLCYLCCCCSCCCQQDQDEEERQELLRDRSHYLRRSSTYYQWNRPPPPSTAQFKHQPHPSQPSSYLPPRYTSSTDQTPPDSWESRRSQLLKKYARDPPH